MRSATAPVAAAPFNFTVSWSASARPSATVTRPSAWKRSAGAGNSSDRSGPAADRDAGKLADGEN